MRRSLALATLLLPSLCWGAPWRVVDGPDYLRSLEALLGRPGIRSVDVIQFRFAKADRPSLRTQGILRRLEELTKTARVRVFLDDHDGGNGPTRELLAAAGIPVRATPKGSTSHTKAVCVDGNTLLLGSTNWTHTSLTRNNEVNLLLEDPGLGKAFTTYFERLWGGDHRNLATTTPGAEGLELLTDSAFLPAARELIGRARETLDVATYFLAYRPHLAEASDRVVGELLETLAARAAEGVRLRFFLDFNGIPGKIGHTRSAMHAVETIRRRVAELAPEANLDDRVQVYWDPHRKISHGKILLRDSESADSELLLGSTNLYWRDLTTNLQLNVRSRNPALNREVLEWYRGQLAQAGTYYRFWRGVRRQVWNPEVLDFYRSRGEQAPCLGDREPVHPVPFTHEDFTCLLNTWLIPATPSYAAETALTAYLPVLPGQPDSRRLHDEVAVIAYADAAEYRRLRSVGGKEGETYGPLHMDVFGRERDGLGSSSRVPRPWTGDFVWDTARGEQVACYDLFSGRPDWQEGHTLVRLVGRDASWDEARTAEFLTDHLEAAQDSRGIDGFLILVGEGYWIEVLHAPVRSGLSAYELSWRREAPAGLTVLDRLPARDLAPTAEDPLAYEWLRRGAGEAGVAGRVRFAPGDKPGHIRHYRLLR
jgi:phosphatidylserine/phosphatidylglycerophosphate/cardiolipin synthase-like enzyme